jgi:metallo-beta-lactamase family protein
MLLDCGLFQGRREETTKRNKEFMFDVRSIDAVVLGHAHIDHCGNLPNLYANGYENPIYATKPTDDLVHYMLPDSAYLQERDVAIMNKKLNKRGFTPVKPLYTIEDAMETIRLINPKPY